MQDLKNFELNELKIIVKNFGFEEYRAKQIFNWIYKNKVVDFDEMKNLPKKLLDKLKRNFTLTSLKILKIQESKDGTKKILYLLPDENKIESVLIPDNERVTLCISSQAGCKCGCKFCATGEIGFKRNLKAGEIVEQFIQALKLEKIDNIVFMGMGEPLLNWEEVKKTISIISDKDGLNFSQKRITVSTIGVIPIIKEIADANYDFYLAISLITPDNELRNKLVPFNKKYSLDDIIKISKYYTGKTGKFITFEYVLLKNINDSEKDAIKLSAILKGINCKINLIPYNNKKTKLFERPQMENVIKFQNILKQKNYKVFIRKEKGSDISAACGQLVGE